MLEASQHLESAFVTLTYDDESCPPELQPREFQQWMKRFRMSYGHPVRFFAVGEYGERTDRPHYHAVLFGVSFLERERMVKTWHHGFVHTIPVAEGLLRYVCGYVLKKSPRARSVQKQQLEREPEFARMSLRPGIGALSASSVARSLKQLPDTARAANEVPVTMRFEKKQYPLGRYIRRQIADSLGVDGGDSLSFSGFGAASLPMDRESRMFRRIKNADAADVRAVREFQQLSRRVL